MGNVLDRIALNGPDPVRIRVETGEIGTDNRVRLRLIDVGGKVSKVFDTDNLLSDDFESNSTSTFTFGDVSEGMESEGDKLGEIAAIEMWRAQGLMDDALFVNVVFVERMKTNTKHVFPMHRRIPQGRHHLFIASYDSYLPQHDKYPEQRKRELLKKKSIYRLAVKKPGFYPQVLEVPEDEEFSSNTKKAFGINIVKAALTSKWKLITSAKPKSIDDIKKLYGSKAIPLPEAAANNWFWEDEYFAEQRVAGINPVQIQRCHSIPEKFAVNNEMLSPFLEGKTIESAIEEKRLFILDYELISRVEFRYPERDVPAPFVLLYRNTEDVLKPVAIQLNQDPGEDNPVYFPDDPPYTWLLAKMWVNVADSTMYTAITHYLLCHVLADPILGFMHREISPSHPVFKLLAPHFIFTLAINRTAGDAYVVGDSLPDTLTAFGIMGTFEAASLVSPTWNFMRDGNLRNFTEKRGVGKDALPHYPYRDDSWPIVEAIEEYVEEVLKNVYPDEVSLKEDFEVQTWYRILSTPISEGGSGIMGLAGDGKEAKLQDLIDIISTIISIVTVHHAALNYNQYQQFGFPAVQPGRLNTKIPTKKVDLTEADIMAALPTPVETGQIMVGYNVVGIRKSDSHLGKFEIKYAYDPKSEAAFEKLRERLTEARKGYLERNEARKYPYRVLDPTGIPHSISL